MSQAIEKPFRHLNIPEANTQPQSPLLAHQAEPLQEPAVGPKQANSPAAESKPTPLSMAASTATVASPSAFVSAASLLTSSSSSSSVNQAARTASALEKNKPHEAKTPGPDPKKIQTIVSDMSAAIGEVIQKNHDMLSNEASTTSPKTAATAATTPTRSHETVASSKKDEGPASCLCGCNQVHLTSGQKEHQILFLTHSSSLSSSCIDYLE